MVVEKHSNSRFPGVVDFPRCSIADIDWYMRMPIDQPTIDPDNERQTKLCEEAGTTQESTFPMR